MPIGNELGNQLILIFLILIIPVIKNYEYLKKTKGNNKIIKDRKSLKRL